MAVTGFLYAARSRPRLSRAVLADAVAG